MVLEVVVSGGDRFLYREAPVEPPIEMYVEGFKTYHNFFEVN